ncbi:MAG: DUF3486 family protein [Pseudomonadota bacterium]
MPPRSKISKLPKAVKDWLDKALAENGFADYELLAADLKERGYDISKSAIHRYGQDFENRLGALRMASEQAKAIVQSSNDDEGAVSEALMRLVQEKLFQTLLDFKIDPDKPVNLASAAKAVAELARATVSQKKWQAEVQAKAVIAADSVESIAKRGGLSAEALDTIRRDILGIAS